MIKQEINKRTVTKIVPFNNELKVGLERQNSDNQSKALNVTDEKSSLHVISVRYCLILLPS